MVIQDPAHFLADGRHVAAVQAHEVQALAPGLHLLGHRHRVPGPGDIVIGVDQQGGDGGEVPGKHPKGVNFVGKTGDVGMGHGPEDGNAVEFPRQDVAGAQKPRQITGPGHLETGVAALGAPQGKIHQGPARGRLDRPGGLGGDHGLEADGVDDERLHQLGLDDGGAHFQDGLICEKDAAFGEGLDLAGEAQTLQEVQKAPRKEAGGGEISQVIVSETQGFQILQDLGQPRGHKVVALGRILADKQAEGGLLLHILVEIAGRHGQLVKVRQQRRQFTRWLLVQVYLSGEAKGPLPT